MDAINNGKTSVQGRGHPVRGMTRMPCDNHHNLEQSVVIHLQTMIFDSKPYFWLQNTIYGEAGACLVSATQHIKIIQQP